MVEGIGWWRGLDGGRVVLWVDEQPSELMERLYRSMSDCTGGSGLARSLAKWLVGLMSVCLSTLASKQPQVNP
jgi:hypothetical protein